MYRRHLGIEPIRAQSVQRKSTTVDVQLRDNISKLQTVAEHLVQRSVEVRTVDYEDHTFSGIMFPVECLNILPIQFIEIQSIAVRGRLGRMSVYTCNYDVSERTPLPRIDAGEWTTRFGPTDCPPHPEDFFELAFPIPLRLAPTQFAGIYVHSEAHGDQAVVYDDQRTDKVRYKDQTLTIHPGFAHTSNVPFRHINHWAHNAWRQGREFVGRVKYGTKYLLWTPLAHDRFPCVFRKGVYSLMCSHHVLGKKSYRNKTLGDIPTDVLYKIINMLPYHWFGDIGDADLGLADDDEVEEEEEEEDGEYAAAQQDDDEFDDDDEDAADDEDDDDLAIHAWLEMLR